MFNVSLMIIFNAIGLMLHDETPEQHSASAIVCYTILGHTNYSGPRVSGGLGIRALHRTPSRAVPPQRDTRKIAPAARESLSFSAPIQIIHATGIVH